MTDKSERKEKDRLSTAMELMQDSEYLNARLHGSDYVNQNVPLDIFIDSVDTRIKQLQSKGVDIPSWNKLKEENDNSLKNAVADLIFRLRNRSYGIKQTDRQNKREKSEKVS